MRSYLQGPWSQTYTYCKNIYFYESIDSLASRRYFRAQFKVKEKVQRLSATLSSSQKRITELEKQLVHLQKEAAKKGGEIEDKMKRELKHLHQDAGIMRNKMETVEGRMAELTRDLVEMEQKLVLVTKKNKDLTTQRSMNAL